MNERIKELAKQVPGWNCNGVYLAPYQPSLEKFAELIVRECSKHIRDRAFQAGAGVTVVGEAELWLADDLEKHFGVE